MGACRRVSRKPHSAARGHDVPLCCLQASTQSCARSWISRPGQDTEFTVACVRCHADGYVPRAGEAMRCGCRWVALFSRVVPERMCRTMYAVQGARSVVSWAWAEDTLGNASVHTVRCARSAPLASRSSDRGCFADTGCCRRASCPPLSSRYACRPAALLPSPCALMVACMRSLKASTWCLRLQGALAARVVSSSAT